MSDQISLTHWLTSPRAGHGLHISAGSGEFSYHPYSDIAAEALHTAQRIRCDPSWRYTELAETHLAPINDPQATAEALLSLVSAT